MQILEHFSVHSGYKLNIYPPCGHTRGIVLYCIIVLNCVATAVAAIMAVTQGID
jgi:hypothetical protein